MRKIDYKIVKLLCQTILRESKVFFRNTSLIIILCLLFPVQFTQAATSLYGGTDTDRNIRATFIKLNILKKTQDLRTKNIIGKKLSQEKVISSLSISKDEQLLKLSEYKNEIQGEYGDEMMIFLNMPTTDSGIEDLAQNMKNIINEYKVNHVKPIFLFEPYDEHHEEIDFSYLKSGAYDSMLRKLFILLRDTYAISSEDIGVLVPYPEINTPAYKRKHFLPKDFPFLINSFFQTAREVYPLVEGGILLDSKSYEVGKNWGQGNFSSFMPYIQGIKPGTLSRFGIQGFPWVSNDGAIEAYDPKEYLPLGITLEASKYLSVKTVWYNTGVMKKKYKKNTVTLSSEITDRILRDTLAQGEKLKEKGYGIHVHIFAQNKFDQFEATDWSFLGDIKSQNTFEKFIAQAKGKNISVSVYDK